MRNPQASPGGTPANDALLIQLVRGALGEDGHFRGTPRINVSSCKFVVTLHGTVGDEEERDRIGVIVRTVPGVRDVENRLGVT